VQSRESRAVARLQGGVEVGAAKDGAEGGGHRQRERMHAHAPLALRVGVEQRRLQEHHAARRQPVIMPQYACHALVAVDARQHKVCTHRPPLFWRRSAGTAAQAQQGRHCSADNSGVAVQRR
jgi:hypothetical protein